MPEQLSFIDTPPHVHTRTSYKAAVRVRSKVEEMRSLILGFIQAKGPVTDQQIQKALGMSGDSERPRRGELKKAGLIEKFDDGGVTRAGNEAQRWVVKGFNRPCSR